MERDDEPPTRSEEVALSNAVSALNESSSRMNFLPSMGFMNLYKEIIDKF
jgi:hypothetical protein